MAHEPASPGEPLQIADPRAVAIVTGIQLGDERAVQRWLVEHPSLATVRIVDEHGVARSLLHVAADWPGHYPNVARIVRVLIAAGADPNAALRPADPAGAPETPLHWAASSDDVNLIDALLDGGADIDAPGAVFTGGTAMSDAVVFAQFHAARRLLERGASTTLWQAAALGLAERVTAWCDATPAPSHEEITNAFWHACRGGQQVTAALLLERGADINWAGHDHKRPLDAAHDSGDHDLMIWLESKGGTRLRG